MAQGLHPGHTAPNFATSKSLKVLALDVPRVLFIGLAELDNAFALL